MDELNGITFPLPDGCEQPRHVAVVLAGAREQAGRWGKGRPAVTPEYVSRPDVVMTTDGTYDCPGDGGIRRHGLLISRTVTDTVETSPKALAEADTPTRPTTPTTATSSADAPSAGSSPTRWWPPGRSRSRATPGTTSAGA